MKADLPPPDASARPARLMGAFLFIAALAISALNVFGRFALRKLELMSRDMLAPGDALPGIGGLVLEHQLWLKACALAIPAVAVAVFVGTKKGRMVHVLLALFLLAGFSLVTILFGWVLGLNHFTAEMSK